MCLLVSFYQFFLKFASFSFLLPFLPLAISYGPLGTHKENAWGRGEAGEKEINIQRTVEVER